MSYSFSTNNSPATGAIAMYTLLSTLITATWTKPKDSDGTTYSSSGVRITGGGSGANGLANNSAWFVVSAPNGRQFCIQRGTTNQAWKIKYSKAAGFVGGSPSATQVPSATDEQVIVGGGTDASPTFYTLFGSDNSYRMSCGCGNSAVGYAFFMTGWLNGSMGVGTFAFMLDVMQSGTYATTGTADTDPAVVYCEGQVSSVFSASSLSYINTQCWAYFNNGGTPSWKNLGALNYCDYSSGRAFAPPATGQFIGVNSFTGNDTLLPLLWARYGQATAPVGFKGASSLLQWEGVLRTNGDVISQASPTAKDGMYFNGAVLPWDGSAVTI